MRTVIVISSLILVLVNSVLAEYIEPSTVKISTEKYPVVSDGLRPARYQYDVTWQGIAVGSAKVSVEPVEVKDHKKPKDIIQISAEAKSAKLVDVFYKLRHHSQSQVSKVGFQPVKFETWQTENSKIKKAEVEFSNGGRIKSYAAKDGKIEREHNFVSENFTLDPISAAFFARSIPMEIGTKASFDIFNGKHRYLITFDVVALEDIQIMGKSRKAFKSIPSVKKLTDTEGETRLTTAAIWIAADETRDVLKLESKVFVGSVNATLVKVESSTAGVALAAVVP